MSAIWIPENLDLTNCDREPIHIPGSIQPHGMLFVVDATSFRIIQTSVNTPTHLSKAPREILDTPIDLIIGAEHAQQLRQAVDRDDFQLFNTNQIELYQDGTPYRYSLLAHKAVDGRLLVELERFVDPYSSFTMQYTLQGALKQLEKSQSVPAMCQVIADTVRTFTGYDRVMVYRFDEQWNGEVIAEARAEELEPYFGLHYPASDIPRQARELYKLNPIRVISDVGYTPISLLSIDENTAPVDMSFAHLRSVSPIHIEYLKNMGVGSSMSISLMIDGDLWGLVACHHMSPKYLNYETRLTCTIIGRVSSLQLAEKERSVRQKREVDATHTLNQLMDQLAQEDDDYIVQGLISKSPNLLDLVEATGVIVAFDGQFYALGETPVITDVQRITTWLSKTHLSGIYVTDKLALENSEFADLKDVASGMLAITISRVQQNYILWFKPEEAKTVYWAGDPEKRATPQPDGSVRLSPRQSFAAWQEVVKYKSTPWLFWEIEIAKRLRTLLIDTAMRIAGELKLRADILANLNRELERSNAELDSFAYVASHDLKEPLRGIHNYAVFLMEDYGKSLPEDAIEKLSTMIRLSQRLESLIDALLQFSRVGRIDLSVQRTDLNELVQDAISLLKPRLELNKVEVRIVSDLPTITCDQVHIVEVFNNLISNAMKYNDKDEKWIEIGSVPSDQEDYVTLFVRDNGIGIREKHYDTIFKIFKRLHGRDSYGGGTGAGLTIVKKIVERHEGTIRVDSQYGQGTTFYFTLKDLKDVSH
jgi:light-regulated signal transduction histidine kinase (bacteriophytochrome)